jgi:hypothetical protein
MLKQKLKIYSFADGTNYNKFDKTVDVGVINVAEFNFDQIYNLSKEYIDLEFIDNGVGSGNSYTLFKIWRNYFGHNAKRNLQAIDEDVLFVGCSHTHGTGHEDRSTTYPYRYAQLRGQSTKIDAIPGGSNEAIEQIIYKYNTKQKNIVVQFTEPHRLFLNQKNIVPNKWNQDLHKVFSDEVIYDNQKRVVERTVNFLRSTGAKFVFFLLLSDVPIENDLFKFIEYCSRFDEFMYWDHYVDRVSDGHLGPISHENIATRLSEHWSRLYA